MSVVVQNNLPMGKIGNLRFTWRCLNFCWSILFSLRVSFTLLNVQKSSNRLIEENITTKILTFVSLILKKTERKIIIDCLLCDRAAGPTVRNFGNGAGVELISCGHVRSWVNLLTWLLIGCSLLQSQSRSQLACCHNSWPWLQLINFHSWCRTLSFVCGRCAG